MGLSDNEYVYIVGDVNTGTFLGYSDDKIIAKAYAKQSPSMVCKKVPKSEIDESRMMNDEILYAMGGTAMTTGEEEYMALASSQYVMDISRYITDFADSLRYIKFTEEELDRLTILFEVLHEFRERVNPEEESYLFPEDMFDPTKIERFFIEEVLGRRGGK